MTDKEGRYILLISVHGLVRGTDMELGRDADTGGQIKYVVELARELVAHPEVARVDLITRQINDSRYDDSYAAPVEELAPGANIIRIPCGPKRYLAKESLWPYLDEFVDNIVPFLRKQDFSPDLIHGHYADAGYVASQLSALLDIPMAFTGHSLGRVKRQRLMESGNTLERIEKRYKIGRRIEAEESALDYAHFVIASTNQEVEQQYELYDNYEPRRMIVIPPGVDLSRFMPPQRGWGHLPDVAQSIQQFLVDWAKPMILALSRPDPRKNIQSLVHAYGQNKSLQDAANLVIIAGNRDDIKNLDRGGREVMQEILYLIDRYNLYGKCAIPKHHDSDEVPKLYQIAAKTRGVFVNPALTEPFGLTLLEAAASGLPLIATHDGGPRDIMAACNNGVLIDPLNVKNLGDVLLNAVKDRDQWRKWSRSGLRGAHRHFSWKAHVSKYMKTARTAISQHLKRKAFYSRKSRLITADRIIVSDIDNTLIGDREGLSKLLQMLRDAGDNVAFGIATGRSLDLTLDVLKEWDIPTPQLLITSVGSEIQYGRHLVSDGGWKRHISYRWRPDSIREAMAELPGLELQPPEGQAEHKISYLVDPEESPSVKQVVKHLRRKNIQSRVIYSHQAYLDILPIRASKGMALRYFALKWNIPLERCLVAGDSGNDEEMLTGNTLGVVVGNYDPELEHLRNHPRIYFADNYYAWGILEGIEQYNFLGSIRIPEQEASSHA